ncbi:YbjN domain-containing protein [Corynebacterium lujinxingii]|uniref:YbjN domain-containing protein n=1 Tax=Corynebacterium lujinxingii TaxID=2763010 RepID=A0A7H0K1K4_9CORY|nr:YbjN domain-containing protein [Corynebacterium lujinxingii]MBC3178634.1 YbjN domain-containing protein [Corynebacterium lujinxingii]NNO10434.1 hypothetical protein [Corynebacterium lujinxingii]QNP91170.1 YbjN domain-containing protein [Corynebacterium lujinxingii]
MATAFPAISQDRIAATLKAMDLKYYQEDTGETRTAFPGLAVFFDVANEGFKASARWMATVRGADQVATFRTRCNEINRTMPLVRVHPVRRDDDTAVALIEAPFFSNDGFSDDQIREMLEYYFSAIHHIAQLLRDALPDVEETLPTNSTGTDSNQEA